jgi:hypothetical protein
LILDFIEKGYRNNTYWESFATQMANLHQQTNDTFGFMENNYIGSLPQLNTPQTDWITFFVEQRLMVQAAIAFNKGLIDRWLINKLEVLSLKLPSYIEHVKPALLRYIMVVVKWKLLLQKCLAEWMIVFTTPILSNIHLRRATNLGLIFIIYTLYSFILIYSDKVI